MLYKRKFLVTLSIAFLLLALIALATFFAMDKARKMLEGESKRNSVLVDFFIKGIKYSQINEIGRFQYSLSAEYVNEYNVLNENFAVNTAEFGGSFSNEDKIIIRNSFVKGEKMTGGCYFFLHPDVEIFGEDGFVWHLKSDKGLQHANSDVINLWGDVILIRKSKNSYDIKIQTDHVTIHTDSGIAKTDEFVDIVQGKNVIKAKGAEVNFRSSSLKLFSNVIGEYFN